MDIKLAERSFFYSTYPNFKRSICPREHVTWSSFQSSSQGLGNDSTNSSRHCPRTSPNSACLLTENGNCFSEPGPWREEQCEKELKGTGWVQERARSTAHPPGGSGWLAFRPRWLLHAGLPQAFLFIPQDSTQKSFPLTSLPFCTLAAPS